MSSASADSEGVKRLVQWSVALQVPVIAIPVASSTDQTDSIYLYCPFETRLLSERSRVRTQLRSNFAQISFGCPVFEITFVMDKRCSALNASRFPFETSNAFMVSGPHCGYLPSSAAQIRLSAATLSRSNKVTSVGATITPAKSLARCWCRRHSKYLCIYPCIYTSLRWVLERKKRILNH